MKKLLLLLTASTLVSCSEYKAMINERIVFETDSVTRFTDKNMSRVKVWIANQPHEFIFDTGAGTTVLNTARFSIDSMKQIASRDVYGFDNKTSVKTAGYNVGVFKTSSFSIGNKYLYYKPVSNNLCSTSNKPDGILERVYAPDGYLTELNYEEGFIRFVKNPDLSGYSSTKADFHISNGTFKIKLSINGIEDYFLFDTGNTTSYLFVDPSKYKSLSDKLQESNELLYGANNVEIPVTVDVFKAECNIGELKFMVPVSTNSAHPKGNLNLAFIKLFNWMIDQKNNKVYFKPKNPELLLQSKQIPVPQPRIRSAVFDDKLKVSYINFKSDSYQAGDEVVRVGDQEVNSTNICEVLKVLNESNDWSALNVQTRKPN